VTFIHTWQFSKFITRICHKMVNTRNQTHTHTHMCTYWSLPIG